MNRLGNKCCVVGCTNDDKQCSSDTKFYRFPSDDEAVSSIQRSMWVEAIQSGRYYVGEGHRQGDLEYTILMNDEAGVTLAVFTDNKHHVSNKCQDVFMTDFQLQLQLTEGTLLLACYPIPVGDDNATTFPPLHQVRFQGIQDRHLNGPTWLPSELSVICSEHFLEIKSVDDPSFIPSLFPAESEAAVNSESQVAEKRVGENENPCEYSVLQKIADRLPLPSAVNRGKVGPVQRQTDTSQLQEAFRELACHVCRMLVAHDSELLIEGTVGITVDGGARVMLLHFADQVRKTDATNEEEIVSQDSAKGNILHDEAKSHGKGINRTPSTTRLSEAKVPDVGNMDCNRTSSPFTAHSLHYSSGSSKILSDLAQQTTGANSADVVTLSAQKRKADFDNSSIYDKPKQQTLLRELLCAPLPPKRPCRPVNPSPTSTKAGIVREVRPDVVSHRRPTANSSVLGGLLRTGSYQRESSFSPQDGLCGGDGHSKHEPGTLAQGGFSGPSVGIDAASPQFGGNAVQALLRLASEHAATGRHDLLRNRNSTQHREVTPSRSETFLGDGAADVSLDRRYNVLYQNLVGSDFGSTSSEFAGMSQNSTLSDSSTTVGITSELAPVKQEVVDPGYE